MGDKISIFADLVKLFLFVLNQSRLYSNKHPAAQLAMRNFLAKLDAVLGADETLAVGFVEGRVVINDQPLDPKTPGVLELAKESRRLNLDGLVFVKGLGEEEVASFFKLVSLPPKVLEEKGGLAKLFEEADFHHVRLENARYKMVRDEETIVHKDEVAGDGAAEAASDVVPGPKRTIESLDGLIGYCLESEGGGVECDSERLIYELEKKPELAASLVIEKGATLATVERAVEELSRFLTEKVVMPLIRQGRDPSQLILRLAREIKKTIDGPDAGEEIKGAAKRIVGILERCADAAKVEMVAAAADSSGGDLDSLGKVIGKVLRGQAARERLLGAVQARLAPLGLAPERVAEFLAARENEAKEARRATISPAELEELNRLRGRFAEELEQRVQEKTAALEREMKQILNEKRRTDAIIRNIAEGLVVVDVEGKIQVMNPAAERLLGIRHQSGKGLPISQILKGEHLLALAKVAPGDESDRVTQEIELKTLDADTRKVLQASSAVIENEDGRTVGMVSVLSDITKQKQIDELKSKFVAHVSHELRTPLVAIDESLAILQRGEVGALHTDQEKFLGIARRNIGRLSRLVNDLLEIAKLEAGRVDLRPTSFDARDMVRHVAETMENWAKEKGLTIEEKYSAPKVPVEADPDRLVQVVTNLLGNAIKFTPEGGRITVEVSDDWRDPKVSAEPCVLIAVEDTGIGIPESEHERIFEKFEQMVVESDAGVASTGLGLTIAREIVDLHGGRIWVESREGEGSRFSLAIPTRFKYKPDEASATNGGPGS
jgi:PAS domain S-box-containing protein